MRGSHLTQGPGMLSSRHAPSGIRPATKASVLDCERRICVRPHSPFLVAIPEDPDGRWLILVLAGIVVGGAVAGLQLAWLSCPAALFVVLALKSASDCPDCGGGAEEIPLAAYHAVFGAVAAIAGTTGALVSFAVSRIRQDRTRCMDRASPDRRDGDVHRGYRALGCTGLGPERPKRRCREPNRRRSLSRGPVAGRLRVQTGGCRFRLRRRACRLAGRQSRRVQPGGRTARGWRPRLNLRPLRSTAVCHSVKPQR